MRLTQITCSYFKKYVDTHIRKSLRKQDFKQPFRGWRVKNNKKYRYTEDRPWTQAAYSAQQQYEYPSILEPIPEWKYFIGDRVEILTGVDKGKQGIVGRVIKERNWCFVEGRNCKYEYIGKSATSPGIMQTIEKPLTVNTEVKLTDPSDHLPTEVVWRYTEEGQKVRVSVRTGRIVPILNKPNEYEDVFIENVNKYKASDKDTSAKALAKVTYKAKLMTFEDDIAEQMDTKDDRKPAKTYWY